MRWLSAPISIAPASTATWGAVDLTAYLGTKAGSVAMVYLEIINVSGGPLEWGIRCNASADDIRGDLPGGAHTFAFTGIDGDDVVELYHETTDIQFHLLAMIEDLAGAHIDEAATKTVTTPDAWEAWDLNAETSGSRPIDVGFFLVKNTGAGANHYGFRAYGSTDDRYADIPAGCLVGACMSAASAQVELLAESSTEITFYFVGWLGEVNAVVEDTTGQQLNALGISSGAVGAYVSTPTNSVVPPGYETLFVHAYPTDNTAYSADFRKEGSDQTSYYDLAVHQYLAVLADAWTGLFEQKIEHTNLDLYLFGWTSAPWQIAAPSVDVADGAWTGNTADLYADIDETLLNLSDADYIRSLTNPSADICEIKLNAVAAPPTRQRQRVSYRYKGSRAGPLAITVSLYQGATLIAYWVHTAISADWVTTTQTLTEAQANSITDYSDLRLKFKADKL